MLYKNIKFIIIHFFIFCCLTSGTLPPVSRQQVLPENYEKRIEKLREKREEKRDSKKQQEAAVYERYKGSRSDNKKNRLAYFADRDGYIWFYNEENKYTFFLSNFYPAKVKIWDMKFASAEGAFQAAKFLHKPHLAERFTDLDGEAAWQLAQRHSYQQREDWYHVREDIMRQVLRAKFKQHSDLKELLLATGDAYLVENSSRDAFWADGGDGKGKNRLGELLMQLRGELGGVGVVSKPAKYKKFVR